MRIELAVVEINRVSILLEEFLKHDDLANAAHHPPRLFLSHGDIIKSVGCMGLLDVTGGAKIQQTGHAF